MLMDLKQKNKQSKAKKKQLKDLMKDIAATALKLSKFQRSIEIQKQERKSLEVFFNLWSSKVKKIRHNIGLAEQGNPIGTYLDDLDQYLRDDDTRDLKMLTEAEMADVEQQKLIKNKPKTFDLAAIIKELSFQVVQGGTAELNVQLLTRNIEASEEAVLFNQVLDGLIFCLSNRNVSLFDFQNRIKPTLSYQAIISNITYSFNYRESSLLTQTSKNIKMDLTKTSLLAVFIKDFSEMENLVQLLDTALPKMAGLHVMLLSLDLDRKQLAQKMGIFTKLINDKKLAHLHNCPIQLPQSEELQKIRKRRVALNTPNFTKYLEFFIEKELRIALSVASLVMTSQMYKFRKVNLGDVVVNTFASFKTLFDYAVTKEAYIFEAEFLKYFRISDHVGEFDNCLQVANCLITAMEGSLKKMINLCEKSSQSLFLHARFDLNTFQNLAIFLPKQIAASSNNFLNFSDLEIKHMAYLLNRSIFFDSNKQEIKRMLKNIELRSKSLIWQKQASIFKGTLIAAVWLEELTKKCKNETIYLLDQQKKQLDDADHQLDQAQWEEKLTESLISQLTGKNRLETAYEPILKQKYAKDFDSASKANIKRKFHERLAMMSKKKVTDSSTQFNAENLNKKTIATKRQEKICQKTNSPQTAKIDKSEVIQEKHSFQHQNDLDLKNELMAMADQASEDSSVQEKKTKRQRRAISSEVEDFIKSLVPGKQLTKVDTAVRKQKKVQNYAAEIFKLIESM